MTAATPTLTHRRHCAQCNAPFVTTLPDWMICIACSERGRARVEAKATESDPSGKSPHEPGAKLDAGKAPVRRGLLEYFPRACLAVAEVSAVGARKYAWNGWESVPEGISRYGDAELRHVCKAAIEGPVDAESGLLHAAHEAWNALARLEMILREREQEPGE